jgi:hypothetical protein
MSYDDPYPEFPNVIDLASWKKYKEKEDEEDLQLSLSYFRELLDELIDEINPSYRTFHIPTGSEGGYLAAFMSGSTPPWELGLEEFEWMKYDGDNYDDEED